jgi:hypothetical protein
MCDLCQKLDRQLCTHVGICITTLLQIFTCDLDVTQHQTFCRRVLIYFLKIYKLTLRFVINACLSAAARIIVLSSNDETVISKSLVVLSD